MYVCICVQDSCEELANDKKKILGLDYFDVVFFYNHFNDIDDG